MNNDVVSGHMRVVGNCENALTELFSGTPPQVVILAGEKISNPLVGRLGASIKGEIDLPLDSHRPGGSNDTSKAVLGDLEGVNVAIIQGRIHDNEGGDHLSSVVIPRAAALAAKDAIFLILNASTGLTPGYVSVGQVAIIGDHICSLAGISPLKGESVFLERFGSCHVTTSYDRDLRQLAGEALSRTRRSGENFNADAVYLMAPGPQLPTLAELKFYSSSCGADLVGTPLPEVLALNQMGRRVLALSMVVDGVLTELSSYEQRVRVISRHAEEFIERIVGMLPHVAPTIVGQGKAVSA